MKDKILLDKFRSKFKRPVKFYKYQLGNEEKILIEVGGLKSGEVKTKAERTEGQHKKKRCICGGHSVRGHKQRWKYPKYKRKR